MADPKVILWTSTLFLVYLFFNGIKVGIEDKLCGHTLLKLCEE